MEKVNSGNESTVEELISAVKSSAMPWKESLQEMGLEDPFKDLSGELLSGQNKQESDPAKDESKD